MRWAPPEFDAALASGDQILPRDFIWLIGGDRSTGAAVPMGVWSDIGDVNVPIIDPLTGGVQNRSFYGAGASIEISDIRYVQGIKVETITIKLLYANGEVVDYFRTYQLKQRPIQIFRGVLSPVSRTMIAPAVPAFFGAVDEAPFEIAKEGETSSITVTATSNTAELTRANSLLRDDPSQRARSATDDFNRDTVVVKDWQQPWGTNAGPIPTGAS